MMSHKEMARILGCAAVTACAVAAFARSRSVARARAGSTEDEDLGPARHVYRIVLTGGPCAGKTTALARLAGYLQERGFRVYTVPEVATLLFTNGVSFGDLGAGDEAVCAFQRAILESQLTLEDGFARVAAATRQPAVLLCDRGAMDGSAYMDKALWESLLKQRSAEQLAAAHSQHGHAHGEDAPMIEFRLFSPERVERALCERYDAVFHLVTAAAGAARFYTLENNVARTETPEDARCADARTQLCWARHPRQIVFDNSAVDLGFEGKLRRVVEAAARLVGLPVLPKSTRKFILHVKPPSSEVFESHGVKLTSFSVTKTFLEPNAALSQRRGGAVVVKTLADMSPEPTPRGAPVFKYAYVRKRSQAGANSYGYAEVWVDPVTDEVNEKKRRCSPREYAAYLGTADTSRKPVEQSRLHFLWCNQSFVIHSYQDKVLAILHCQAARPDGSIDFPPFLQVGDEITDSYGAYDVSKLP